MKRIIFFITVILFCFQQGIYPSQKKIGVVVDIQPEGMALIYSKDRTTKLKRYSEISAGDIIEIQKQGKIEIILTNYKTVTLKNPRKIKIQDDYTLVDVISGKQDTGSVKRDKFAEALAKDIKRSGLSAMGASRGEEEVPSEKVLNEIKEAEKIQDEVLKHTALYHIYRQNCYKNLMKKEAGYLKKLESEGKRENSK